MFKESWEKFQKKILEIRRIPDGNPENILKGILKAIPFASRIDSKILLRILPEFFYSILQGVLSLSTYSGFGGSFAAGFLQKLLPCFCPEFSSGFASRRPSEIFFFSIRMRMCARAFHGVHPKEPPGNIRLKIPIIKKINNNKISCMLPEISVNF